MAVLPKRMSNLLKRTPTDLATTLEKKENPETRAPRLIKDFCDASSENSSAADEVIYLPYIRDAVEASPAAAKAGLKAIHKFLAASTMAKAGALYNAVMLVRILTDSPGPAFTSQFDDRFVGTIRSMLKNCNRQEPQLLLQQTLEYFQREKSSDTNLTPLIEMWQRQKEEWSNVAMRSQAYANSGPPAQRAPLVYPSPQEMAERIAEAETSVQLLTQFLQTTPQDELPNNELIREFTNRCKSARDSMQSYIDSTNPVPDHETMTTLIQTQQRISVVLNKRNVAMSQARQAFGGAPSPAPSRQTTNTGGVAANGLVSPPLPATNGANGTAAAATNGTTPATSPPVLPALGVATDPASRLDNPFDDSNQIGQPPASDAEVPKDTGALGGNRARPSLNVATSLSSSRQNSTGNVAEARPANANRFRIV